MKHTDENGIEWTVIGEYQVAAIAGDIVAVPTPGVLFETEEEANNAALAFRRDMDALINAGFIVPAPGVEQ